MSKIFILILCPFDLQFELRNEYIVMLENLIYEFSIIKVFSVHNSTIHILSDKKHKSDLKKSLDRIESTLNIRLLDDNYADWNTMNHHLNIHVQRAMVSTDANYFLVLSSNLPLFTHRIFTECINWESDINLGLTQDSSSALILFQKQFTPFFFKLSDSSILTGDRNLILFKQYQRKTTIIHHPSCYSLDYNNIEIMNEILHGLELEKNSYQKELYHLIRASCRE
jgi:hypothetical protein